MNKIVSTKESITLAQKLHSQQKTIVLVGGVFDILHIGHVAYLQEAKKHANKLFILLESDESVKKTKGPTHPIHTQKERAIVLEALSCTDYIVLLEGVYTNNDYDKLVLQLKPAIIAATKGDPNRTHKERQSRLIGAEVIDVLTRIGNNSSSSLAKRIKESYS